MAFIGWSDRIKIGLMGIGWFILGMLYLLSIPVMKAWTIWVLIAALVLGLVLAQPVFLLFHFLLRRRPDYPLMRLRVWTRSVIATVLIVGIITAYPVYYLAYVVEGDPLIVPQVTLTKGNRTVVFQGMIHIGSESFFKSVVYDLEVALEEGYRLYYEGVQPGDETSDQWFADKLAGGGDLGDRYKELAMTCEMVFQNDYFSLMEKDSHRRPDQHVTADVTTADMMREYERLMQEDPEFANQMKEIEAAKEEQMADLENLMSEFIEWQQQGTEDQKSLAGVLCRGVLSVANRASIETHKRKPMDPVILDLRNAYLVRMMLEDPAEKIYVTYGAAHLPGVLELMKQADPEWQITSIKWMRPIEAPEHFEGRL